MLDLSLALVPRRREQGLVIVPRQVRSQQRDCRQRDRAIGHELENDRKPSGCSRRLDAVIGRVLGQVQYLRAIGEQRGTTFAEVEPARVDSPISASSSAVACRAAPAARVVRSSSSRSEILSIEIVVMSLHSTTISQGRTNDDVTDRAPGTRPDSFLRGSMLARDDAAQGTALTGGQGSQPNAFGKRVNWFLLFCAPTRKYFRRPTRSGPSWAEPEARRRSSTRRILPHASAHVVTSRPA